MPHLPVTLPIVFPKQRPRRPPGPAIFLRPRPLRPASLAVHLTRRPCPALPRRTPLLAEGPAPLTQGAYPPSSGLWAVSESSLTSALLAGWKSGFSSPPRQGGRRPRPSPLERGLRPSARYGRRGGGAEGQR